MKKTNIKKIEIISRKTANAKILRSYNLAVLRSSICYINASNEGAYKNALPDVKKMLANNEIKISGGSRQEKKIRGAKHLETTFVEKLKREIANVKRTFAMEIAENVHKIVPLYRSERGYIIFNSKGGEVDKDWNAYSRTYAYPAVWKNAGVIIEDGKIRCYNVRQKMVFEMDCPSYRDIIKGKYISNNTNISAVYGIRTTGGMYKMYDINKKHITNAFLLEMNGKNSKYWEHGANKAEILAERDRKKAIQIAYLKAKEAAELKKAADLALKTKKERFIRLAKKLINNIDVTYDDARAVGYCNAGIMNFIETHLHGKKIAKVGVLKRFKQTERLVNATYEKLFNQKYNSI